MSKTYEVERVLNKKIYRGQVYYQLKWIGCKSPSWEKESNCHCDQLIKDYEALLKKESNDEDEDEWEVEEILKKRERNNGLEYLVKWKNWDGEPTWVKERDCQCTNLIAAYENPKLKKLWSFEGSNKRLWIGREEMLDYLKKYVDKKGAPVNVLEFEEDFPQDERPLKLRDGLNIGPLLYRHHWYLVVVFINFLGVSKKMLVGDPLNTLTGVRQTYVHPVYKRLVTVYKGIPVKTLLMTPMDRSDVCAFYVIAAFERALKLYRDGAQFAPDQLFFSFRRAELIRSKMKPESNDEISAGLPINRVFLDGPRCEFCDNLYDTYDCLDKHILRKHFTSKKTGSQSCYLSID